MSSLEKILQPLLYVIRHQKKMLALALASALFFSIVFFPYDDLSDLISELIAKNSQNQVFVQFDQLGIGFLPPSVKMSNVEVDTPLLPTLKAGALYLAPSIAGFLAFSPGFSATIQDVLKGDLSLSYRGGKKVNNDLRMQKVSLDVSKVDLSELSKYASLPCKLEGPLSMQVDSEVDPSFVEQPDGEYELSSGKLRVNPCVLVLQRLPFPIPNINLSQIKIRGTIKAGVLAIEEGVLGKAGDTLHGRFKGRLGIRLVRSGSQVIPDISSYEFKLDLNIDKSAEKSLGVYLIPFDSYKTVTGAGARYALTLSAPNTQTPPNASPLGNF